MEQEIRAQLERIERLVTSLVDQQQVWEWYSTAELARAVDRSEFTVREWCRLDRINAQKRGSGRGAFQDWAISHAELRRYQQEGLLPRKRRA